MQFLLMNQFYMDVDLNCDCDWETIYIHISKLKESNSILAINIVFIFHVELHKGKSFESSGRNVIVCSTQSGIQEGSP